MLSADIKRKLNNILLKGTKERKKKEQMYKLQEEKMDGYHQKDEQNANRKLGILKLNRYKN